jgi:hypothetical protein
MDCECNKLISEIERGIDSMVKQKAPSFVIEDYIEEMKSGEWVGCVNCPNRNESDNSD